MSSALAMWAYHRRLSMEAKDPITTEPDPQIGIEKTERRKQRPSRTDSESSAPTIDERRVSIDPAEDSEEDETKQQTSQEHSHHEKGHRRFSLDFLFSKKRKNKKEKSKQKRSHSIAAQNEQEDAETRYREMRYPGLTVNDFSMYYFI